MEREFLSIQNLTQSFQLHELLVSLAKLAENQTNKHKVGTVQRTKVNANSEKIFNQYENRLQKLGAETRTKGFPFNLYREEGKPAFKPDVNSNGNLMFKGYQGEVIITNEKAAKINK